MGVALGDLLVRCCSPVLRDRATLARPLAGLALAAATMVIARTSVAQTYATILDSSENQSIEGVRRLSADEVLLACSYTENDDPTQGMWWTGSLATGVGTAYKIVPQLAGQTVTSSVFYGPNTAFVNPALGTNIQIVGSYKYAESPTPDLNVGLL